jgi:large subunit ribosomal protein L10
MGKAYREASALGVKAAIPTKDTIGPLLAKARAEMLAIAARAPGLEDDRLKQLTAVAAPAPQEKKAEPKKEEEKKPEVSEEEAAAGLSALFG